MSYFMETICKLYIGGCIAAGEGGGAQPGEGEGEREGDKGEEPALQHSGPEIMGAGRDDLEDMTDLSDRTDYCPLCVTRP